MLWLRRFGVAASAVLSAAATSVLLLSLIPAPVAAGPCDRDPTDPRCGGTTTSMPGTTTSSPGTTTTTAPAGEWPVAVIGCSNTEQVVRAADDSGLFDPKVAVGGEFWRWADPGFRAWAKFENQLHPGIETVWWQLCQKSGTLRADYQADMESILATAAGLIKEHGADLNTVFVSALNEYPDESYPRFKAWEVTVEMAEWAVANLDVSPGPVMPLLGPDHLESDNIHPNAAGEAAAAAVLIDFFGG